MKKTLNVENLIPYEIHSLMTGYIFMHRFRPPPDKRRDRGQIQEICEPCIEMQTKIVSTFSDMRNVLN